MESLRRCDPNRRVVVPKLRGMEGFDWFASDPEVFDVFNQAMTNFSELAVAPVTAAYDFSGYSTIVDVGGGHGRLLAGILATAPTAKGILFDVPDVVAGVGPLLRKHNVADRVRVAGGSFFDSAPEGCDLYVMKTSSTTGRTTGLSRYVQVGGSYQVPSGAVHDAKAGEKGGKVIATYVVEKGKPLASPAP